MITDETKKRIWDEIIKQGKVLPRVLPGERTQAQIRREYGLTKSQAERILGELIMKGLATKHEALTSEGKHCIAYSFQEDIESVFNL